MFFFLYYCLDVQNLLSVVTSLLAFAYYTNKDYDKVLTTLDCKVQSQDISFNDSYLKGQDLNPLELLFKFLKFLIKTFLNV